MPAIVDPFDNAAPAVAEIVDPFDTAPKREVGAGEAYGRGIGSTFSSQGNVLALAAGAPAMAVDWARSKITGQPSTAAQDFVFSNVVDPTKRAMDYYNIDPNTEQTSGWGTAANVAGRITGMVPSMIASGGAAAPAQTFRGTIPLARAAIQARQPMEAAKIVAQTVAPSAATGAVTAQPSFVLPNTIERTGQLLDAGVDRPTVAKASAANYVMNTLQGAAPVSVAGGALARMGSGAAMNAGLGAAQRGVEGQILGPENARLAQSPTDPEQMGMDAGIGAVMAALFGPRGAPPMSARSNPQPATPPPEIKINPGEGLSIAELIAKNTGAPVLPDAPTDRAAAIAAQDKARAERGREVRNTFRPVVGNESTVYPQLADVPTSMDQRVERASRAVGETPESVAKSFEQAYAQSTAANRVPLQRDVTASESRAPWLRQTFDIAEGQRERKQAGVDAGNKGPRRDLRDARAGGTTTAEGTAATKPEQFTFYGATIENGQMTDGERVDVVRRGLTMLDGEGKEIPASEVRFSEREDAPVQIVPDEKLTSLSRPTNPRYAQTIMGEYRRGADGNVSYERNVYPPPRGVGKGDQQPAPRAAAQRITGQPTSRELPAQEIPRQPEIPPAQQPKAAVDQPSARAEPQPNPGAPINEADFRNFLEGFKSDIGAEGKGGRLIIDEANRNSQPGIGDVLGRTAWEGHPWWFERPNQDLLAPAAKNAVDKYLAGKRLGAREQRFIDYLRERIDAENARGAEEQAAAVKWESAADARADESFDMGAEGRELSPAEADAFWSEIDAKSVPNREGAPVAENADTGTVTADRQGGAEAQRQSSAQKRDDLQPGRNDGNAPGRSDQGGVARDGGNAEARNAGESSGDAGFGLKGETEAEIRAREAQQQREQSQQSARENAPPADDFVMTGSNRNADEAAARGQQELGDGPGGKLYGGFPLDAMAKAVKDAFGWGASEAKAWSDSARAFLDDLKDVKQHIPSITDNPVTRFVRAAFDSASGDIRAELRKYKSPTADWIVDQFHVMAGSDRPTGEIYSQAVAAWTNTQLSRLQSAVGKFSGDKASLEQITNLVRNPDGIRRGTAVGDTAFAIRSMLDDALKYLREAGVDVGEVKNGYFPREYDTAAIMSNPQGFIDAAAQAYRETGLDPVSAKESATALHDTLLYGDIGSLFRGNSGNVRSPFLKGRVFGKSVDAESHPLRKFMVNDPMIALPVYLQRAARRAELARRFGDNFSKWDEIAQKVKDEGGADLLGDLKDYVSLAAGLKNPDAGFSRNKMTGIRVASAIRTWASLMFLEKATLSSLTEFITPAIRSGNILDAGKSLQTTIAHLLDKTTDAKQRAAMAEDLGIITSHLADTINAARFSGGEPVSLLESKVLDKYFRRTGLTQWTDATRVAGMEIGRTFIRRLAIEFGDTGGKLSSRYLKELGVPEAQVKQFADFVRNTRDGMPLPEDLKGPMGDVYRKAVRRFVAQSIMQPDATMRPAWTRSPWGAVVAQLQSFNYALWENVWKRNGRLVKEAMTGTDYTHMERMRLILPMLTMPTLAIAAYAVGEARDAVFGDPNKRKQETTGDKLLKAASRGAPIAPIDPFVNYLTAARYQRGAADFFAGPALGTFGRGMDAARNVAMNNSDKTNTAERQAAKAFYDIMVEPTVNFALAVAPATPFAKIAAAAATQAIGAGGTKEAFVSTVAGEDKRKNSKPRQ